MQAVAAKFATCRFCKATGRVVEATGRCDGPLRMPIKCRKIVRPAAVAMPVTCLFLYVHIPVETMKRYREHILFNDVYIENSSESRFVIRQFCFRSCL